MRRSKYDLALYFASRLTLNNIALKGCILLLWFFHACVRTENAWHAMAAIKEDFFYQTVGELSKINRACHLKSSKLLPERETQDCVQWAVQKPTAQKQECSIPNKLLSIKFCRRNYRSNGYYEVYRFRYLRRRSLSQY